MEKINNYDWLNLIPPGWENLARKMIQECEAINPSYQIADMKEKWGELRVYSFIKDYDDNDWLIPSHNDEEIDKIEIKYIEQSSKICCICGKPATKFSTGWICPYCDNCGDKDEKFYKRFK